MSHLPAMLAHIETCLAALGQLQTPNALSLSARLRDFGTLLGRRDGAAASDYRAIVEGLPERDFTRGGSWDEQIKGLDHCRGSRRNAFAILVAGRVFRDLMSNAVAAAPDQLALISDADASALCAA